MNLVAKEFAAARADGNGVLVLSEFAGAAQELAEALHVNPYDIEGSADTYYRALTMRPGERRARMRALRRRVAAYDVHRWADTFVSELEAATVTPPVSSPAMSPPAMIEILLRRLRSAEHLVLLLDYDGTLVPFAPTPELAVPDEDLLALLRALAGRAPWCPWSVDGLARGWRAGSATYRSACTPSTVSGRVRQAPRTGPPPTSRPRAGVPRCLAILQDFRRAHARLAGRGEDGESGLALSGDRPGVRGQPGQRAACPPHADPGQTNRSSCSPATTSSRCGHRASRKDASRVRSLHRRPRGPCSRPWGGGRSH
jgi:hypothetical protein